MIYSEQDDEISSGCCVPSNIRFTWRPGARIVKAMRKEGVVSPSHALATSTRQASACRLVLAVALILVMNFRPVGKPVRRSILLATLRQYIEVAVDYGKAVFLLRISLAALWRVHRATRHLSQKQHVDIK